MEPVSDEQLRKWDSRPPGSEDGPPPEAARHKGNGQEPPPGEQEEPSTPLREVSLSDLQSAALNPPSFILEHLIPCGETTLFGGHGGSGKSIETLSLLAHVACGRVHGPLRVIQGPVAYFSFEDPEAIVKYRLRRIADHFHLPYDVLIDNFRVFDATDCGPLAFEANTNGVRQLLFTALMEEVSAIAADMLLFAVDNASDAYDADENSRRQVRKFVRRLTKIARATGGACLLLAHLNKAAARFGAEGNSYSGSTAWHNSVRSRIALVDGELRHEKTNHGKLIDPLVMKWTDTGVPYLLTKDLAAASDNDDEVLECINLANKRGYVVSVAASGPNTPWTALSELPEFPRSLLDAKDGKGRLKKAIGRLLADSKIRRETYTDNYRNKREKWVCVAPDATAEDR